MNFELTNLEVDLIVELLDRELKTLPVGIHHTKHREYKEYLKEREKLVESLHKKFLK